MNINTESYYMDEALKPIAENYILLLIQSGIDSI